MKKVSLYQNGPNYSEQEPDTNLTPEQSEGPPAELSEASDNGSHSGIGLPTASSSHDDIDIASTRMCVHA